MTATAAPPSKLQSRSRELITEAFSGTPGRMRIFGAVAVAACLLFGVLTFAAGLRYNGELNDAQDHAAQLVRIQTLRTSLVQADANATNAFLVGGLEPTDVRDGYNAGITTAAATLAAASSAEPGDAAALEKVNQALANYTGLIESARANNRQGFPVGAAYLRTASKSIRDDALPVLEALVEKQRDGFDSSSKAASTAKTETLWLLALTLGALLAAQAWLFARTRRIINRPLAAATALVAIGGLLGLSVFAWTDERVKSARNGAYANTVAIATVRIDGFDAKSAESLTLIARGSGQAYEDEFNDVTEAASAALAPAIPDNKFGDPETRVRTTLNAYLIQHRAMRQLDTDGKYDEAVAAATGRGKANVAFANFEKASNVALNTRATQLSDDLDTARRPLLVTSWVMLLAGLAAALAAQRGFAQRLREYR